MKNTADVSAHFKMLHKRCRKYLILFCADKKPEDLHRLRVTIKRMNALFNLLSKTEKKFKQTKYYKPYRKIFKAAGRIREAQLHLLILKNKEKQTVASFKETIQTETQALITNSRRYIRAIESIADKIEKTAWRVSKGDVTKYLQKERKGLLHSMFVLSAPSALHPLRKKIKRLLYNYELTKGTGTKKAKTLIYNLDILQQDIGLWHDKEVLLKQLEESSPMSGQRRVINKSAEKKLTEIELGLSLLRKQLYNTATKN
jgi:CHAD domain-containing protein